MAGVHFCRQSLQYNVLRFGEKSLPLLATEVGKEQFIARQDQVTFFIALTESDLAHRQTIALSSEQVLR